MAACMHPSHACFGGGRHTLRGQHTHAAPCARCHTLSICTVATLRVRYAALPSHSTTAKSAAMGMMELQQVKQAEGSCARAQLTQRAEGGALAKGLGPCMQHGRSMDAACVSARMWVMYSCVYRPRHQDRRAHAGWQHVGGWYPGRAVVEAHLNLPTSRLWPCTMHAWWGSHQVGHPQALFVLGLWLHGCQCAWMHVPRSARPLRVTCRLSWGWGERCRYM